MEGMLLGFPQGVGKRVCGRGKEGGVVRIHERRGRERPVLLGERWCYGLGPNGNTGWVLLMQRCILFLAQCVSNKEIKFVNSDA